MATKNFSQMTTKKLNALLATASDEDKAKIQEVLQARAAVAAEPTPDHTVGGAESTDVIMDELTPEEQAQVDAAEANGGKVAKAPRLTDDERQAIVDKLKAEVVGHKCQVLPMGKAEWANGVVTGIMNDKRANNIMLNIKLEDGRLVRKMHNAETLRVLDETVELTAGRRGRQASTEPKVDTPWDTMEDEITAIAGNVGRVASLDGVELGRVTTIVPDKRVKMLLYRIIVPGDETTPAKTIHKSKNANLVFAELDAEGQKIQDDFIARRSKIVSRIPQTPAQKLAQAELDLQKANERVVAAQARVAQLEALIEKLRAEAEATVAQAEAAEAPEETAEQPAAEADELA